MIKIKTKKGEIAIKMKGDDPEVLADLVFLLASIGKASGERIEKMPEQMRTELRTSQIKAFVKTLNGESCEETIRGILHGSASNIHSITFGRNI
ncbi:MAG: hypothetical protein IJN83_08550 [Clostridia bacterium]|nr:hypothetical protein [Clostridia bacterium]